MASRRSESSTEPKVAGSSPAGCISTDKDLREVKVVQEAVRLATYRAAWSFDRAEDPLQTPMLTSSGFTPGTSIVICSSESVSDRLRDEIDNSAESAHSLSRRARNRSKMSSIALGNVDAGLIDRTRIAIGAPKQRRSES